MPNRVSTGPATSAVINSNPKLGPNSVNEDLAKVTAISRSTAAAALLSQVLGTPVLSSVACRSRGNFYMHKCMGKTVNCSVLYLLLVFSITYSPDILELTPQNFK